MEQQRSTDEEVLVVMNDHDDHQTMEREIAELSQHMISKTMCFTFLFLSCLCVCKDFLNFFQRVLYK